MILLNFNTIKWQDEIVNNLKHNIKERTLGHAILFFNDVSTGNMLANATADSVLCKEHSGNACLRCSNCTKTIAGSHPDKFIITGKKNSIGIEEIREVISQMYIKPCNSDYKIFIFAEANKLTGAAQNALLKILEQPPEYGIIILVTEKEEDLLPTVLSRLIKFSISQPGKEKISEYLYLKYPEKKQLSNFAASYFEGDPVSAEKFLLNDCDFDKRKRILTFLQKLTLCNKSPIFDFANYLTDDKENLNTNISYIQLFLKDIVFVKSNMSDNLLTNSDLSEQIKKISSKFSVSNINNFSSALATILYNKKRNASLKLSITNMLISIWEELHGRNS